MALADGSRIVQADSRFSFETVEPRRLFAFAPVGAAGVFGSNVTAVESAAASNDAQSTRYATYVDNAGNGFVVPVTGADDAAPATPIRLPNNGGSISQTDVAAESANGSAIVTYTVDTSIQTGSANSDVYAVVIANNQIVGTSVRVNTTTTGYQNNARVSEFSDGSFVVVWQSEIGTAIVAREFTSTGTPDSAELAVATAGSNPDISANGQGDFAVVWTSGSGTFAREFDNGGAPLTTTATVSQTANFSNPSVGLANNGNFLVAFADTVNSTRLIRAQLFQNGGGALGNAFTVSENTGLNQTAPTVAVDTTNGFVVGWAQASAGTNYNQAAFRQLNSAGTALDASVTINGVTFGSDFRFGLASRIPGTVHAAYNTGTVGNIQQYVNAGGGGGGNPGTERPAPAGALVIDLTNSTAGRVLDVTQSSSNFTVTLDGTSTNYARGSYTSIYVLGGGFDDSLTLESSVTVPSIIYARAGIDTVSGGSGNDYIDGGNGGERTVVQHGKSRTITLGNTIYGNVGNDYVYGGGDSDTIYGGANSDRILAGPGYRDLVYGGNGNDVLLGGNRNSQLYGQNGNDSITGGTGDDFIDGGAGDDVLSGGDGDDVIYGQAGNDLLGGDLGNDLLHGGRGDDRVLGNAGNDTLYGDADADYLRGGGSSSMGLGNTGGDIAYADGLDTLVGITFRIGVR